MLTKPKQGKSFQVYRAEVMNVPEDYDDDVEWKNTHPNLLLKPEQDTKAQKVSPAVLAKTVTGKLSDKQKFDLQYFCRYKKKLSAKQLTLSKLLKDKQISNL